MFVSLSNAYHDVILSITFHSISLDNAILKDSVTSRLMGNQQFQFQTKKVNIIGNPHLSKQRYTKFQQEQTKSLLGYINKCLLKLQSFLMVPFSQNIYRFKSLECIKHKHLK